MRLWEVYAPVTEIDAPELKPEIMPAGTDLLATLQDEYGDRLDKLGQGAFSVVFDTPNITNTVLKRGSVMLGKRSFANPDGLYYTDAYVNYVLALQRQTGFPQSAGNPYFPQVHKLVFFPQPGSTQDEPIYHFTAEIEKLKPLPGGLLRDQDGEPVTVDGFIAYLENNPQSLMSQIFATMQRVTDFGISTLLERSQQDKHVHVDDLFDVYFRSVIDDVAGTKIAVDITDRTLKQAVIIIKRFARAGVGGLDVHSGNIMYRPTPYGVQFVFTDIFA